MMSQTKQLWLKKAAAARHTSERELAVVVYHQTCGDVVTDDVATAFAG